MSGRYPGGYEGGYDSGHWNDSGDWEDPRAQRNSGPYREQGGAQQGPGQQAWGQQGAGGVWDSDAPLPGDAYGGDSDAYGGDSYSQDGYGSPAGYRDPGRADWQAAPRGGSAQPSAAQYGPAQYGPAQHGAAQPGASRQDSGSYRTQPGRDPRRSGAYSPVSRADSGAYPQQDGWREPRATRDPRESRDPRDSRDPQQMGGLRMTANDYPGGDFLPGFDGPDDDRDRGGREAGRRGRGTPARDDRYQDDRYADPRFRQDRYQGDRYQGERYPGDDYARDPYDRGGYDDDRYGRAGTAEEDWTERSAGEEENERDRRGRRGGGKPKRRRGIRRAAPWVALVVVLIFLIPLVGGGLYVYHYIQAKNHPPDYVGVGTGKVLVQVNSGDTATSLAPKLVELGVVKSSRAFILAAEHSTSTASLEAGFFNLKHDMQASLAYASLINPKNRVQNTLTLPEGLRVTDTLIRLGKDSGIPQSAFEAAIKEVPQLGLPSYAESKPEGYLFPSQYIILPNDTALSILQEMVKRFKQHAAADGLPASLTVHARGGSLKLTARQLVVVASLIQAEAGRTKDMPDIAEVVYNRLTTGMKLQFDSTVFYGLGTYGTRASQAQYNTPSPYNTYMNTGLPVGPIDSPGDDAIKAALHPATGTFLYFFGCSNGTTEFSSVHALSGC